MEKFAREDLQHFDGKGGRSAYVAIDGKVYDLSLSGFWQGGEHMGRHDAGCDLTEALAGAPHGREVLERVAQIGVVKEDAGVSEDAPSATKQPPPAWALKLLRMHPHPISVHFPQALFTLAPVFLVLFYVFKNPDFERTCFFLAIAGWITAFPAFATGLFHWIFKHGKSTKGLYVFKLAMSAVLIVYGAVVIYLHATRGVLAPEPVDVLMLVLYVLVLPAIVAIGHAGGKIVFG